MDNTYKTNKYKLPLLEIVGMTSTECTFAVAFAYMESEQKENFCWALEKLKGMFIKEGLFPQVILPPRPLHRTPSCRRSFRPMRIILPPCPLHRTIE